MEFRILGPLEVWDADRALHLGGAKHRALLAILLLEANRVVKGGPTETTYNWRRRQGKRRRR